MRTVVFWLGRARETWGYRSALNTGIGGSELAMIRLADGLAEQGVRVTVYADISDPDTVPTNPRWRSIHDEYLSADTRYCDLLVSSRCPSFVDLERQKKGFPTWLWMHDLHVGADWGNFIATNFNKVVCLSRFAKERFGQYYPKVQPRNVAIIPNGVSPALFRVRGFADQHDCSPLHLMWSSCPDRGLERVLDLLPALRELHSDTQLDVYGDLETWAARAVGEQKLLASRLSEKLKRPGVVVHGAAGQEPLAKAWQQTHLWLYPTSFEETSCITALEAQAAGAKIVCSAVGALPETAPGAHFLSPYEPTTAWQIETLNVIHRALGTTGKSELARARGRLSTWGDVTRAWLDEIDWSLGRLP
jgi:protein O-GlcNAc transferase